MRNLVIDLLEQAAECYDLLAVTYDCVLQQPRPLVRELSDYSWEFADPQWNWRRELESATDEQLLCIYSLYTTTWDQWHQIDDSIWEYKDRVQDQWGCDRPWQTYLWQDDHPRILAVDRVD